MSDGNVVVFTDSKRPPDEEYDDLVEKGKLPATTLDLPKTHISVTQVHLYQNCPKAYYWRYVKDLIVPPAARAIEGKAVHQSLEKGHRERMSSGKMAPLELLLEAHNDAWKDMKPEIETWDEDHDENSILKRARMFLTQYHTKHLPALKPVGVEKRFWWTVGQRHIPVLGFIDLILDKPKEAAEDPGNCPEVVDYKVVARSKSQADIDSDLQLTTYSRATGIPQVRFDQFVKTTSPTVKILQSRRDVKSYRWAEAVFEGVAQAINAGIFPPCNTGSWICTEKWCGYWSRCRGGK